MAQAWKMDAILVTEMTRWGRSTIDLMQTLQQLHAWGILLVATCEHSIQPKHVSRSVDYESDGNICRV